MLRVSGAGKGQYGIENLLFQLRGHAGNVGRGHQLSIMENKRDIGTMPWGAAALNGEILIEEIAPHRAGFRPAADIAHGRLPEQYIQKRQVGGAAFGVGGVEQRQQGIRRLLAQHFFGKAFGLGGAHLRFVQAEAIEGGKLAKHGAHQKGNAGGFGAERIFQRVTQIKGVGVWGAAGVFSGGFQGGGYFIISGGKRGIGYRFQCGDIRRAKLRHQSLGAVPPAAGAVGQAAQNAAHHNTFVEQPVRGGGLQQGGHLGAAAGLAEHCHIAGVTAERGNIIPHPAQRGDDIVPARVAGIGVFRPKIRKVEIAQDVQPVVDGNHHAVPQAGHVFALVSDLLNGGTGKVSAAVQPHQHGAMGVIQRGGPDVQVLAGFVHQPIAVGHQHFAVGLGHFQQRADIAVTGGVQHAVPHSWLRRVEAPGLGVRDALKDIQSVKTVAAHRAAGGAHQRGIGRTRKSMGHSKLLSSSGQK